MFLLYKLYIYICVYTIAEVAGVGREIKKKLEKNLKVKPSTHGLHNIKC